MSQGKATHASSVPAITAPALVGSRDVQALQSGSEQIKVSKQLPAGGRTKGGRDGSDS